MNSVLAAPFETISFGQDAPRYSGAWRPKRHDFGLVPPVDPNAAVDPIVATDSHAFAGDIDRFVTREMGSLGYLTMDVARRVGIPSIDLCVLRRGWVAPPTGTCSSRLGW